MSETDEKPRSSRYGERRRCFTVHCEILYKRWMFGFFGRNAGAFSGNRSDRVGWNCGLFNIWIAGKRFFRESEIARGSPLDQVEQDLRSMLIKFLAPSTEYPKIHLFPAAARSNTNITKNPQFIFQLETTSRLFIVVCTKNIGPLDLNASLRNATCMKNQRAYVFTVISIGIHGWNSSRNDGRSVGDRFSRWKGLFPAGSGRLFEGIYL